MRLWTATLILSACGPGDAPTWHQDVAPIVAAECAVCHDGSGAAPFALTSYAQAWAAGPPALLAVESGRMPPWKPDPDCRHYPGERLLEPEQIATFRAWFDAGMPEGDPDTAAPLPHIELPTFEPTHTLTGTHGYTAAAMNSDDYRCFLLDFSAEETLYLTASGVVPGTPQVHHALVYAVSKDTLSTVEAADAADDGPGYTCFGGPVPGGEGTDALQTLIGSWVPGSRPAIYGEGLAVRIPAGSGAVLQLHYSALGGSPEPDDSSVVELRLTTEVPEVLSRSGPLPILDLRIPAGESDVRFERTYTNYSDEDVVIAAMSGHMHLLGKQVRLDVVRADGGQECALDIPDWEFIWQQGYALAADDLITVGPGDAVKVSCAFDNSEGNQPKVGGELIEPREVYWGDGTLDEMCIVYVTRLEPWTPEPPPAEICDPEATCACASDDFACLLSCDTAGLECGLCAASALGDCGTDACGLEWLGALGCITDCGYNSVLFAGSIGACMQAECGTRLEALSGCLEPLQAPGGDCEDALVPCGL